MKEQKDTILSRLKWYHKLGISIGGFAVGLTGGIAIALTIWQ